MNDFYTVAIGMSAGGLEALEELMANLPTDSHGAFIIISHLPKVSVSKLDEVIARISNLRVQWIKNDMEIRIGNCYIQPAGYCTTFKDGKFHLKKRGENNKVNRTIDHFFQSLADDTDGSLIGIILSGTGQDGLEGVHAIERKNGIVMVQDPSTAHFTGMPHSIIARDHPDLVLSPKDMALSLHNFLRFAPSH